MSPKGRKNKLKQNEPTKVRFVIGGEGGIPLPPSQTVQAVVATSNPEVKKVFEDFIPQIKVLGRLESLTVDAKFQKSNAYLGNAFSDFEVFIKIEGLVNPEEENKRIQKKIAEVEGWIKAISGKLANENFVKNAPKEIVDEERTKLADAQKLLQSHREHAALFQ